VEANFINPFLFSSVYVIESVIQIKPSIGKIKVSEIREIENTLLLKIGIVGQIERDVLFGFPKYMIMKIVSKMMGGYTVTEYDEMCQSALAELGNMITGNASSMLMDEGYKVDITPPNIIDDMTKYRGIKAFQIPLQIESIGEFNISITV
jgi:chemotaxis protein CheX